MYGGREGYSFVLSCMDIELSPPLLLKTVLSSLVLDSLPLICMSLHMPLSFSLDYCSKCAHATFIPFQDCFHSSEFLPFPYELKFLKD